jgi:hypothetical protein
MFIVTNVKKRKDFSEKEKSFQNSLLLSILLGPYRPLGRHIATVF